MNTNDFYPSAFSDSSTYHQWSQYYSDLNQQLFPNPGLQGVSWLPEYPNMAQNWDDYWKCYPTQAVPYPDVSTSAPPFHCSPISTPSTTFNYSPISTPSTSNVFYSTTPSPTVNQANVPVKKSLICTNCQATETCKWRNVKKQNVLCNACFVYERKYKRSRPFEAVVAFNERKVKSEQKNAKFTHSPY